MNWIIIILVPSPFFCGKKSSFVTDSISHALFLIQQILLTGEPFQAHKMNTK